MLVHLLPLLTFALIALIVYIGMRWLVQGNATVERLGHTEKRSLAFGPLTVALAGVVPMTQRGRQTIAAELRHAGHYRPFALEEFLATRNALIVCWLLLVATALFALVRPVNDPTPLILIAGVVGLVVCFAVPRLVLQSQATRRLARIRVGLPDALDMITMCLSGGLPLQTALERVSGELRGTHPDFAWELDIIRRHCAAHTLEHALVQFSDRIDVPEVKSLTALSTQTEQ